jgi:hypothetical protein
VPAPPLSAPVPTPVARRFHFKIDPNTPLKDLLPVAPRIRRPVGPLQTDDLTRVPEVTFQEPWAKDLAKEKALERTAHAIAKINHLNQKDTDGFLKALLQQRSDLAGLSFAMGDACRTKGERSREFKSAVATVRRALQQAQAGTAVVETTVLPAPPPPVVQPQPVQQLPNAPDLPPGAAPEGP